MSDLKSFGKETDLGIRHCDNHNFDYKCIGLSVGRNVIEQPCPKCTEDAVEVKRQKEIENELVKKQKALSVKFRASGIPPRYTTRNFENFTCKSNAQKKALEMAMQYYENISENMNTGAGLILSGKPGTGKTHLACAIGCKYVGVGTVMFSTVSSMIRRIRSSYRNGSAQSEQDIIDEFRNIDLLVIDEIGIQKGSDSEEHLLFEVINERYAYFKPTILISNLNADEIKQFIGERSLDRMREGGGKFISFNWESYRGNVRSDTSLPDLDGAMYSLNPKAEFGNGYSQAMLNRK